VGEKGENTVASQKYTPVSSRARDLLSYIFFFRLIGFKEFK
jgi:hypothetical protein